MNNVLKLLDTNLDFDVLCLFQLYWFMTLLIETISF